MRLYLLTYYMKLVLLLEGVFMVFPLIVAWYDGEYQTAKAFLLTIAVVLLLALILTFISGKKEHHAIWAKEGLVIVAVCWILLSVAGALPYWFSGAIESPIDCLFESTSGFTTTAASVIRDVEALPRGLQLWRSLSLWIGGMGVLAFLLAVIPLISHSRLFYQVIKAESPGPAPGKLMPRFRQSAKLLYGIYIGLTILEALFLCLGGMPLFDSAMTSMATAGTGGFTIHNNSIGAFGSLYIEIIIMIFMVLCGLNYNILFYLLIRHFGCIGRNDESKVYFGILGGATLLVGANLLLSGQYGIGNSLRYSSFQVISILTTTGFTTVDMSLFPEFSKIILFLLMFVGACAGSSGGGLKIVRVILLFREGKRIFLRMLYPRSVGIVKLDGKGVDKQTVHGAANYINIYFLIYFSSLLLVSLDDFDMETTFTAVAACFNNVGAGLGMVSATGEYATFSPLSKLVLMLNMLLGRLELYPILTLLSVRTWRRT